MDKTNESDAQCTEEGPEPSSPCPTTVDEQSMLLAPRRDRRHSYVNAMPTISMSAVFVRDVIQSVPILWSTPVSHGNIRGNHPQLPPGVISARRVLELETIEESAENGDAPLR